MGNSRRSFIKAIGAATAASVLPGQWAAGKETAAKKSHLVTLSFDDGFKKSFARTVEIYEKYKLAACLNIVAASLPIDRYIQDSPLGDFTLWNEFKRRGHEVMPHGYRHENLQKLTFSEGQELIKRCLGVFAEKLEGFDPKQAIFNTHGLDAEGWGPIRARFLERLLERLLAIETVEILPAGRALARYAA